MPKEWLVKLVVPPNLHMENEGEFGKLMSDESYTLALELSNFSASRKAALESSQKKLDEEIEKAYNDSYVNFFLQIQGDTSQSTIWAYLRNSTEGTAGQAAGDTQAGRQAKDRAGNQDAEGQPGQREHLL